MATLKFFDLQGVPLTLFEVRKFLLPDLGEIKSGLNDEFELAKPFKRLRDEQRGRERDEGMEKVKLGKILQIFEDLVKENAVSESQGYYCLPGRQNIIAERLRNYAYGIQRERRIRRFVPWLRFIPFVRGAAIGGSQAMGQQTQASDIDLFIVTDETHMFIARTLVSLFFQIFGVRRHGEKIANRFCLNHYVAGPHLVSDERDPYNAMEYLRLRSAVYPQGIGEFLSINQNWIREFYPNAFYPNAKFFLSAPQAQSWPQRLGEGILKNRFGLRLNGKLGRWQLARIKRGEYAVATERELSFHSKARKYELLKQFMEM